uniref:Calcium voltage-gated channel subunit alpha1 I n=1 Tax=Cyprinus carpio TaxID=7962 RepID=A0A8C1Z152_CYPCA
MNPLQFSHEPPGFSALVVPYPELAPIVFFCLKQTTCPRSCCIRMVSISMMVILLNCVTLGMYQPCENIDCSSERCQILQAFDAFIYIFFALEMVVKMVALGIFGRRCYLGDTWNRLDFFIVMAGVVEYSLDLQNINLTAIRTVRVLRPLKAINRVPSMRILVSLLLDTLPMLGNVLLLCFFVFFIFGIIGVQLWAGLLRNRCYPEENFTLSTGVALPAPYYSPDEEDERPFICSLPQDNGIMSCGDVPARRVAGHQCCLDVDDVLHHQALGLVTEPFLNASAVVPGLCVNWNRYYTRCHTGHRNPHKGAINFDNIGYAWIVIFQVITLEGWVEIMYYVMDAHSFYNFIYFILLIIVGSFFMINLCLVVIATQFSETKQREHQLMQEQRATRLSSSTLASLVEPSDCYEEIFQLVCHVLRKGRRRTALFSHCTTDGAAPDASAANQETEGEAPNETERFKRAEGACWGRSRELWMEMRVKLRGIVESKYFNRGIMVAILINTISMGIEHHEQPEELTNVLEICNIVFTSMFALEMILKLTALGFFSYLRNPYNIFDGIIVIISVCEIVGQSDGCLSVLRTFRLLRVLKLVRFMPALRRQLVVLMKTMDNVATFCMLLMLFIFIFSILGMHIFGCKFSLKTDTGDTVPDRKNFDSLLWAIVTVFQVQRERDGCMCVCVYVCVCVCVSQSLCFRIQKMMEVYRPDWCERREDWSIYLFSPQNKFRLLCQTIIAHKLFDYVVLAFIFLNCITVALERPRIHQGSLERVFLTISNYVFTAIFVAEMTVKVVSKGLYLGDRAYLRSSWNILDGFLVFVSLIDIVVSMTGGAKILGVLRVLRLLRTLRPLRVISRAPGLKLVVETLITSLKPIGNIVLICCAFFIIFGILGVQLFKGKFYYCVGLDVKNITNKSDCLSANYRWVHHKYNFDNLGQVRPVINNNPWMLLYFISFLLIVSFFVLNMFVGVVVENFHKCRQHQEVEEARRREEKRLKRMEKRRRKAQRLPYYSSYGRVRLMIHSFCTSHYLDLFITLIICINVVTMSLEHYNQPQSLETALKYCNYFFSSTFVVEAMLKLIAFGFRRFFKDRWNQLDLAIVLLSVMGITLEEIEINASLPINPTIIRIMRVLRIARVLKLLKMATGMRALLDTVVQALPQVGNLGLLFVLLFFIYAALGVELFGELVCNVEYPCEGMSRHATFENFGMAFLTLFQVSTGDNWNGIMKDTLRECPPGDSYSCNSSLQIISPMYFVSFVLTAQFVLINVVVAVLMKHLDDSNKEAQEDAEMDAEIEMELAQGGLCCLGRPERPTGADVGERPAGGCGNRQAAMAAVHTHENLWLESVSLLMKESLDGEMQMIDNLSGSVFHHYCSPAIRRDGRSQSGEVRMPNAIPKRFVSALDPKYLLELPLRFYFKLKFNLIKHLYAQFSDINNYNNNNLILLWGKNTCRVPLKRADGLFVADGSGGEGQTSSPLFHLPAEFFHPTTAAIPQGSPAIGAAQPGSRHASPASWASLRSPGANSRTSHRNSSLATGSSVSSLQTMLEEGISTLPVICRTHIPPPELTQRPCTPQTLFNLQATRGRQRNRSRYSDCTNPNWIRQDPSDEDTGSGVRAGGPDQAGNPEQLSDNRSSYSLTSLHPPDSLAPLLAKKCNSTGSLVLGSLAVRNKDGRCLYGFDPWTEATTEESERDASPIGTKTCSQTLGSGCRKNR